MRTVLQWRRKACTSLLALGVMAGVSAARAQSPAQKTSGDSAKSDSFATAGASDSPRAKLIVDTRRLLTLSREIQAETVKNGPDTLSLGTVKKVEELQKLAAVVKAEMGKVQ